MKHFVSLLLLSPFLAASIQAEDYIEYFTPILSPVAQDVIGVRLPPFCTAHRQVVNTLVTIEPAYPGTNLTILTYPPNLVTATVEEDKLLSLWFDEEIARAADAGGVIVQIPNEQFRKLDACCSSQGQVRRGFTHLESIEVTTRSSVRAEIEVNSNNSTALNPPLRVEVSYRADLFVHYIGGAIDKAIASISGSLTVVARTINYVELTTSATSEMYLDSPVGWGYINKSSEVLISALGSCDKLSIHETADCQDEDAELSMDPGNQTQMDEFVYIGFPFTHDGKETCSDTGDIRSNAIAAFGMRLHQQILVAAGAGAAWLFAVL